MPFTDADADRLTKRLKAIPESDDPKDYDWVHGLPEAPPMDDTDELSVIAVPVKPPRPRK